MLSIHTAMRLIFTFLLINSLIISTEFFAMSSDKGKQRAEQIEQAVATCDICLDEKRTEEFSQLSCGHSYCTNCLTQLTDIAIRERNTSQLKCSHQHCAQKLSEQDVRKLVNNDPAKMEAYSNVTLQECLAQEASIKNCPTPNCSYAFANENNNWEIFTCPQCKQQYCSLCLANHTQENTCEEAREAKEKISAEERETEEWKRVNTSPCPACHKIIHRYAGCPAMSCTCGHQFCWNCLGPYGHEFHSCDYSADKKRQPKATSSTTPQVIQRPNPPVANRAGIHPNLFGANRVVNRNHANGPARIENQPAGQNQPRALIQSFELHPSLRIFYPGDTYKLYPHGMSPAHPLKFNVVIHFDRRVTEIFFDNFYRFMNQPNLARRHEQILRQTANDGGRYIELVTRMDQQELQRIITRANKMNLGQ